MSTKETKAEPDASGLTCESCHVTGCYRRDKSFPSFCVTDGIGREAIDATTKKYKGKSLDALIARTAAEIEGEYYGKLTRVEETIAFAHRIGAKRIGIATCIGLIEEARIYAQVLEVHGLEPVAVICKVGSVDKTTIGIPEEKKLKPGQYESMCNPILQAQYLNKRSADLNVMIGLCVGHDALFIRHAKAPTTTLIVKDRVLGHNPFAALHCAGFYYRRLLYPEEGLLTKEFVKGK
jgi:uncharacterized metal-binding protein